MNDQACSIAEIRLQLEIANALANDHISFVVIPVSTRDGFEMLCLHQAHNLEALATAAEEEQSKGKSK